MTIHDLMINDLVLYKGHVKKVVGIKRSYNLVDLAINDKDFFTCSITDIEPIPLTEEILDKIGFIGDTRFAYGYNKGGVYLITIRAEVGEIEIADEKGHEQTGYVCRSVKIPSLNCVHELQHALRLCGLIDFADTLKTT